MSIIQTEMCNDKNLKDFLFILNDNYHFSETLLYFHKRQTVTKVKLFPFLTVSIA